MKFLLPYMLLIILLPACRRESGHPAPSRRARIPADMEAACACTPGKHPSTPGGEGIWPWHILDRLDTGSLAFRGLEIPLQELWKPQGGGHLQAVVKLSGCTASFVSPQGLLLTNYHCVSSAIQKISTAEHNYLEDGFFARKQSEELPAPGLSVQMVQAQREITDEILKPIPEKVPDFEIALLLRKKEQEIIQECERGRAVRCQVFRENEGLRFWLVEFTEIPDVRLVYFLPDAVSTFGGDVDNWRWPRHSMDFALLRAYVRPDGKPGPYAPENVPFAPPQRLEFSTAGVSEGDFIMVPGFPARTYRHRTAREVLYALERVYPRREALFSRWTEVLQRVEELDPESRHLHTIQLHRLGNARIHARGQMEGIARNRLVARRLSEEENLRAWTRSHPFPVPENVLEEINSFMENIPKRDLDFLLEQMAIGVNAFGAARLLVRWVYERTLPPERQTPGYRDADLPDVRRQLELAFMNYHELTDRLVMAMFLDEIDRLAPEQRPSFHVPAATEEDRRKREEWLVQAFGATTLSSPAVREEILASSWEALQQNPDPLIQFAIKWHPEFMDMEKRKILVEGAQIRLRRTWMRAVEAFKGRLYYPDADGSPRVSFAHVAGYAPEDGVWFGPFTTLRGMLAKHRGVAPFALPGSFLDFAQSEDYGRWEDAQLDDIPLNFLGNADTSSGNSGSPVLDGRGRIVGLNFDRVYENIAGDFGYHPSRSRNIMMDARTILWVLERYALAHGLLAEMGVQSAPRTTQPAP